MNFFRQFQVILGQKIPIRHFFEHPCFTFFISLLCLVVYVLSESWINILDEYVSLNEIFKIQCGDGDGITDKYCFDFTLTRDANLITIVIFPMVFYAGWAGVFSYLINPLIEYRVLHEKTVENS